jgi:hypothetical protein
VYGCRNYTDVRTVTTAENVRYVCETFQDACIRSGLLSDDRAWRDCLDEAQDICTNYTRILETFVIIVIWCQVSMIPDLWNRYEERLIAEVLYRYPSLGVDHAAARNRLLHELQREFTPHDRYNHEFFIDDPVGVDIHLMSRRELLAAEHHPDPYTAWEDPVGTHTIHSYPIPVTEPLSEIFDHLPMEIRASTSQYNGVALHQESHRMETEMQHHNPEQFEVYQTILHDILYGNSERSRGHFIDSPAGTCHMLSR